MFSPDVRGNCYDYPDKWTDPGSAEEAQWAKEECAACPLLLACHEFAGQHRWHYPTVIAGWQPPEPPHRLKSMTGGVLPPWTPKGWKPLRPLAGSGLRRRNR